MLALSDDQRKVFEVIAEEQPHPVVAPLSTIVAELTAMGLVATDLSPESSSKLSIVRHLEGDGR